MAESKNQLVRGLNLTDSTSLVIGKVIGTGVFLKAAVMMQYVHTPTLMLMAWAAAGLLSLAGALAYAELGAMFPKAGGEYVYLRAAYGDAPAFLYGWMQIFVGQTGIIAALGIAAATFMSSFIHVNAVWLHQSFAVFGKTIDWRFGPQQVIAVSLISLFSAVNCIGVVMGGRTQTALTAAKLLGVAIIIIGVFFVSHQGSWSNLESPTGVPSWSGFAPFGAAMLASLWAYNGWANLPMAAGEVKNPSRNIPRALIGGMIVVVVVYVLVNLSYVYILSPTEVITSFSTAYPEALPVVTKAVRTFLSSGGEKFISIIFVISALGSLNAGVLTAARVPFAMAKDGLFFSGIARLGSKSRVPVWAIMIQGIWACILALSGSFDQLTDFAVFALWLFFGLTAAAVIVLRRKMPNAERPYKTIGYPVLPLAFIAVAAWLVVNTLYTNPWGSGTGLALIALGLLCYFYFRDRTRRTQLSASIEKSTQT